MRMIETSTNNRMTAGNGQGRIRADQAPVHVPASPARLAAGLALLGVAALGPVTAWSSTLTIPLQNLTGLTPTNHTIYVLGFSSGRTAPTVVPPQMLVVNPTNQTGRFAPNPTNSPDGHGADVPLFIPSYKLGPEITRIVVDRAADSVAGARIYFFAADNRLAYASNGLPPRFAYTGNGAHVVQCPNPPQTDYPIYNYIELTYILGETTNAVIDVSSVDGFNFPISITLNDNLARPLGQPLGYAASNFNRQIILGAYAAFMTNLAAEGGRAYLPLAYTNNSGGLLNPTFYMDPSYEAGWTSALNQAFDSGLNAFFSTNHAPTLSITTDGKGAVPSDTYTATYRPHAVFPGSALTHAALVFTGKHHGCSFTVFNPVNFTVVNYTASNALHHINGQMSNTWLNFTQPLPANTPIVTNMYVTGPGANDQTRVTALHTNAHGQLVSLSLSNGSGVAAPGNFRFSKAADVLAISSGAMTFGCGGLFDHPQGLAGDQQAVFLALKRDIVTAFNRGVALRGPATGADGRTSTFWGTQTNWYPAGQAQNLFSLYMHTATVRVGTNMVPLFTRPANAVACARGTLMGMSYGFAYDENSVHAPAGQPQVPSKHDPLPVGVSTSTVTLGAWQPVASVHPANDFNGDRQSDFALLDQASGHWYVLSADQSSMVSWALPWGWSGAWPVSGDFNGDATSDFGVFDQVSGCWYVLDADQSTIVAWALPWGWPGAWPVHGDYDGDHRTDYGVFDQASGCWYVLGSDQSTIQTWALPWGWPGAWPVVGDYDGDHKRDFAVFDQVAGRWFVLGADQTTILAWDLGWGWPGAWPLYGDYDGDGRHDFSVFDQTTGWWYVLAADQATPLAWALPWGWPGAAPVTGDYNGDGRTDFAVFDQASGCWYVLSADQTTILAWALPWGWPGAWPVGWR